MCVLFQAFNYLSAIYLTIGVPKGLPMSNILKEMALYYDLRTKDVYQLILKVFEFAKDFPREYKFATWAGYETGCPRSCSQYLQSKQGEEQNEVGLEGRFFFMQ